MKRASRRWLIALGVCWLASAIAPAAPAEQLIRTNQPGQMINKEHGVEYIAAGHPAVVAPTNQWLSFHDALRTLDLGRATVRLKDWKHVYLRDRSQLKILPDDSGTNSPTLRLLEGEMYLSRGGGAVTLPVEAAGTRGTPKGTEFLVSVAGGVATFTMFEGEVELVNALGRVTVTNGWQAIAEPGQPPRLLARIEARNLVQWWLYYPAVLEPAELPFTLAEQTQLAASLAAYRSGHLALALQNYPGYPTSGRPGSDAPRTYLAALHLSVGAVDQAEGLLVGLVETNAASALALRWMIQVIQGHTPSALSSFEFLIPKSPSLQLAQSYAHQATNNLRAALTAARQATTAPGPISGFAWARVAEMEFAFGRTRAAREAVERALKVSPGNAQAHCVHGFLLAASYEFPEALAAFDRALELDSFLANAWLGRGLVKRRMRSGSVISRSVNQSESNAPHRASTDSLNTDSLITSPDWLSDLQTAAAVEPRRSLVRAYAGKAFSEAGQGALALKELAYAAQLDPHDPTPSLYQALELHQQNRPNEAIRALERSIALNDNRAVYRSRLLLDLDHATRSASLAKIYQDAGLEDVALREAARAVSYDYASHSAHQFLAESYNALRDPTRFNLRYETVWFNELLLANLLSPVGAGLLSQNISQQEYARLFEANHVGLLTSTEYRSDGQFREIASHYGLVDRLSYTLDLDYQHNEGTRRNSDLDRMEWYSQFKYQLTARDSVFLLTKYQDYESGDNFQHYDPAYASPSFRFQESQAPIVLAALHREWMPGSHTTLLGGRLHSDVQARSGAVVLDLWTNQPPPGINWVRRPSFSNATDAAEFTAYLAEVNQVWQGERHLTIAGARFQGGDFAARNVIDGSANTNNYYNLPVTTQVEEPFHRWSLYGYQTCEVIEHLRLTAGLAYERLSHPANFRLAPLGSGRKEQAAWLPKAALQWDVRPNLSVRGLYAQSLGGLSYDESVRLEPTQLAGFAQTFRNVISEAEAGSVVAPRYEVGGLALDAKFATGTFLGAQAQWLGSEVDQAIGVFRSTGDLAPPPQAIASTTQERLRYEEASFALSVDQLVGREWSFGTAYRLSQSRLHWDYPEVPDDPIRFPLNPERMESALLHHLQFRVHYQHPCGVFSRAEANWFLQDNQGYGHSIYSTTRPGDTAYQLDLFAGCRFWRRRGEVTFGCLNAAGQDYRLNSLTPYPDLPRERVWSARVRLNF